MSLRKFALFSALAAALAFGAGDAFARAGGGSSSGSRGARTYSTPSATPTAPRSAAPMERSITQQPSVNPGMAARPSGGFFSGAFGKGLLGGLVGAGLIGMLFGNGLAGGLGGLMSILGLVLQIGLIVLLVRFAISWFRGRQPQMAGAGAAPGRPQGDASYRAAMGPIGGGAAPPRPLEIGKSDFDAFERRLAEIQAAYSAENVGALRGMTTPEMASYFEGEISNNSSRGLVNKIGDIRLLQGDLAESWREPDAEYATVAMRFSLTDAMIERASGKVVSGSTSAAEEATELWTFRRAQGADSNAWVLSAIQQAR
jgi:predicted lipid-binding transport protein (Tim44 family)